jgi:hypothetical protein
MKEVILPEAVISRLEGFLHHENHEHQLSGFYVELIDYLRVSNLTPEQLVALRKFKASKGAKKGLNVFQVLVQKAYLIDLLSITKSPLNKEQICQIFEEKNEGVSLFSNVSLVSLTKLLKSFNIPGKELRSLFYKANEEDNFLNASTYVPHDATGYLQSLSYLKIPIDKVFELLQDKSNPAKKESASDSIFGLADLNYVILGFKEMKLSPENWARFLSVLKVEKFDRLSSDGLNKDASLVSALIKYGTTVFTSPSEQFPTENEGLKECYEELAKLEVPVNPVNLNLCNKDLVKNVLDFISFARNIRFEIDPRKRNLRIPQSSPLNGNRSLSLSSRLQKMEVD